MKTHTKITYTVLPVGETAKQYKTIQKGLFDKETADEAFDYKNKLNHIITEHQYNSKYGILENWYIDEVEHLSQCDIGAKNAIKLLSHIKRNKTLNINPILKEEKKNFWLDPYGKFHEVSAPGEFGDSHNEWAHNYIKTLNKSIFDILDFGECAYEYLEKIGFIRIQSWSKKYGICFFTKKQPTLNQWNSIFDFCIAQNIKVPSYNKRGWFE